MSLFKSLFVFSIVFCIGFNVQSKAQDSLIVSTDSSMTDSTNVDTIIQTSNQETKIKSQRERFSFVLYLISSELYDDAQHVLGKLNRDSIENRNLKDSVSYYIGWLKYFKQDFYGAISSFETIDSSSTVLTPSAFYNSICQIQIDSLSNAKRILEHIDVTSDGQLENLKTLQLRGISLLQRDYLEYDSLTNLSVERSFITESEMSEMSNYAQAMRSYKRKSPWIAGLLSAILPGLGKFYAGYRGIPFGAMYMTIPLGAIAAESLIIAGVASAQFIALGALFGVFYAGNIWGSALSVYAKEKEFYDEIDHNIEFDLHTPIRRAFR